MVDMNKLSREQFPIIYEHGQPKAVVVDVETFDRLVSTVSHLQHLADDPQEVHWIAEVIARTRAYRQAHPEEVFTYNSPEEVLVALEEPETE
jgi:hypothetical protein